jgi:hypothetical protein
MSDKKKPMDPTSRKSMLEHGIIVTDRGIFLKDKEEVVRAQAERILKMLAEAEALAAKAAAAKAKK